MAASTTPGAARLRPTDWLQAAFDRMSAEGVDAIRVEVLARDLKVSKGSFYWHFRDRGDLLERLLADWESRELGWLEREEDSTNAATRWAKLIERTTDPARIRHEVALRAWARADERVARRVVEVDKKRAGLIADVLRDVGFAPSAAESWSDMVLLICLGWLDRATRDPQYQMANRGLGELLSEMVLAASARTTASHR
ncbi:MAG: TetR/AcrR family transcriptional regulator [Candidatus Acidiferrales bacterium]